MFKKLRSWHLVPYKEELVNLLKNKKINEDDPYKRKAKLIRYAVGKGYSLSMVMEIVNGNEQ